MRKPKLSSIVIFLVFIGFAHGYVISMIKNKDRIEDAYYYTGKNDKYHRREIDKLIKKNKFEEAYDFIEEEERDSIGNYNTLLLENPAYIPLSER